MAKFIVKCRYTKTMEDGAEKKVTEQYLVDAVTCSEAEEIAYKELDGCEDLSVTSVSECKVDEIIGEGHDTFYNAKVVFTSLNETIGKEAKTNYNWIVNADSFSEAYKAVKQRLIGIMSDATISGITETKIVEYIKREEE